MFTTKKSIIENQIIYNLVFSVKSPLIFQIKKGQLLLDSNVCCFQNRLRFWFAANQISNEIDNSKAVHSGDNDYNLAVQSLRKGLSPGLRGHWS